MKIDVLGTSFVIQSDQDPAYLRDVVDFYKSKVTEIQASVSTSDPLKISILASMLIIDDYFKFKSGQAPADNLDDIEAAHITQRLIRQLDAMIERTPSSETTGKPKLSS